MLVRRPPKRDETRKKKEVARLDTPTEGEQAETRAASDAEASEQQVSAERKKKKWAAEGWKPIMK